MESRTVNEMLDRFEREHLPTLRQNTIEDYKRLIRNLRRSFGDMVASAVTRKDIAKFMDVRTGKIGRNKLVSALSSAYKEALKWGWVDSNPCMYVERHESEPNDRQLTDEEFNAFKELAAKVKTSGTGARVLLVMGFARLTGQLQGAILELRWPQVNDRRGVIQFRQDATGKRVAVAITPEIRRLLDEAKKLCGQGEFVILSRKGKKYTGAGFRAVWQRLMRKFEKTGNEKFTFHDIRRLHLVSVKASDAEKTGDTLSKFPQFDTHLRSESENMARHYQVFYCLERTIRRVVVDIMDRAHGTDWWETKVDSDTRREVERTLTKEIDSAITQRSERKIDYTNFTQLSKIIVQNWADFEHMYSSGPAVSGVMAILNKIRMSIAHCCPLPEQEAQRLTLTVKDWFNNVVR